MTALPVEDILFHIFAAVATISALLVVFLSNPIYSAMFLALGMSVLGGLFFMLEGYFISAAQIVVYAGAVMVLFVMVIMLFDLRHERENVLRLTLGTIIKVAAVALLCGFLIGTSWLVISSPSNGHTVNITLAPDTSTKDLEKTPLSAQAAKDVKEANPDEDLTSAEAASLVEKQNGQAPVAANTNNTTTINLSAAATTAVTTSNAGAASNQNSFGSTRLLSERLFTKYVFAFEAVSILLLVAIVGAVALARSRGGTHHVA